MKSNLNLPVAHHSQLFALQQMHFVHLYPSQDLVEHESRKRIPMVKVVTMMEYESLAMRCANRTITGYIS
jgi:hypothetical protein